MNALQVKTPISQHTGKPQHAATTKVQGKKILLGETFLGQLVSRT
jgi:hypothetical protein